MGLVDKIYEDGKYASKAMGKLIGIKKNRMDNKRRQEAEKAKKEADKKKKVKEDPMSRGKKIFYTIFICLASIISIPFSVYLSSSLLNKLKKAKGNNADLDLKLPSNSETKPYAEISRQAWNLKKEKDNTAFSSSVKESSQTGGRRKKRIQRGGGIENDVKTFTDTTKYGFPYNLADNDNPLINSFPIYFITFFSFVRGFIVSAMELLNDSYFKNFQPEKGSGSFSSNTGDKMLDFATIAFILPFLVICSHFIIYIAGSVGLFWSGINNQSIGMFWLLPCAIITFLFGGNWPTTHFLLPMGVIYLLSSDYINSLDIFRKYMKRYKFWWLFLIFCIWGINIWGFMGGGFNSSYKKITREHDFMTWIIAGCGVPVVALIIGIIGFGDMFSSYDLV